MGINIKLLNKKSIKQINNNFIKHVHSLDVIQNLKEIKRDENKQATTLWTSSWLRK